MLRVTTENFPAVAQRRIAPLDRARTLITLLVVMHNAMLAYSSLGPADRERWIGFDLVVLFNDSLVMASMFFISGLFVCNGLTAKGAAMFLRDRAVRLGIPLLISILLLMPIAAYPGLLRDHAAEVGVLQAWWRALIVGSGASGSVWLLGMLLVFDTMAAVTWRLAPKTVSAAGRRLFVARNRSRMLFALLLAITAAVYLPMRLGFGDANWLAFGPLVLQPSRVLLYAVYFLCGMLIGASNLWVGVLAEAGTLARRWPLWLGLAVLAYVVILVLTYARYNWVSFDDPPLWWQIGHGLALVTCSAAISFTLPAFLLRFANKDWGVLDWMRPSAYGIYLLHFIMVAWTQYAVDDLAWPTAVKFAIVFIVTLSMSWLLTLALRRIPLVARVI
jgi:peptidoglycan/LPS O-acetylase OafA/YrhL